MKIFIDTIDVSELLLDIKYESDLSGSSRSSIFGSIETEQLELVVKNKHDGERLYIDDNEYAITECDYDEKSERTTVKAITDLRALDDEFELVGGASASEEKVISFKDFELTGNKPNLIPNGWDSFEPYGSGKNHVENWNFESDDLTGFRGWSTTYTIKNNMLYIYETGDIGDANAGWTGVLPKGKYKVRYKVKAPFGLRERLWLNTSVENTNIPRDKSNEFVVYEREFEVIDETKPIRVSFYPTNGATGTPHKGNYLYIDWIQITPVDNQHLVVEKTHLGKGLTRIQTWGGNHVSKLLSRMVKPVEGNQYTYSLFIENKITNAVLIRSNSAVLSEVVPKGKKHITKTETSEGDLWIGFIIRTIDKNDNLDFIASDPQVVEGDVPNAVMTVDTLPDGKEEVNIYGARSDTELVYKADAVTGEPYELYGNIENLGREIKLSSTLGDSHIKKGENQVNLKGDAKNREVAIKIGVA